MAPKILQKSFQLLTKQQTNILSAAFILMTTVLVSQVLGLVRQRLLLATFSASNTAGTYLYATRWPELLFQLIIISKERTTRQQSLCWPGQFHSPAINQPGRVISMC